MFGQTFCVDTKEYQSNHQNGSPCISTLKQQRALQEGNHNQHTYFCMAISRPLLQDTNKFGSIVEEGFEFNNQVITNDVASGQCKGASLPIDSILDNKGCEFMGAKTSSNNKNSNNTTTSTLHVYIPYLSNTIFVLFCYQVYVILTIGIAQNSHMNQNILKS